MKTNYCSYSVVKYKRQNKTFRIVSPLLDSYVERALLLQPKVHLFDYFFTLRIKSVFI